MLILFIINISVFYCKKRSVSVDFHFFRAELPNAPIQTKVIYFLIRNLSYLAQVLISASGELAAGIIEGQMLKAMEMNCG